MSKELSAKEAEALALEFCKGGDMYWWERFEYKGDDGEWVKKEPNTFHEIRAYRLKQKKIKIGKRKINAPLEVLPESGCVYTASPAVAEGYSAWNVEEAFAKRALELSQAFATPEDAIAARDAQAVLMGGGE